MASDSMLMRFLSPYVVGAVPGDRGAGVPAERLIREIPSRRVSVIECMQAVTVVHGLSRTSIEQFITRVGQDRSGPCLGFKGGE